MHICQNINNLLTDIVWFHSYMIQKRKRITNYSIGDLVKFIQG